jgi:hypothetical protein
MPTMQFQVPQFIETEDKIVGPLTLKQFLYIAAAGGASLFLYFAIPTMSIWLVCTIFLVGIAIALGFLKYEGQSLPQLLANSMKFLWEPKMYAWQPDNPHIPKTESAMRDFFGGGLDLEKIISGKALKKKWQAVETGNTTGIVLPASHMKYQSFRKQTGERMFAKKVDYR